MTHFCLGDEWELVTEEKTKWNALEIVAFTSKHAKKSAFFADDAKLVGLVIMLP